MLLGLISRLQSNIWKTSDGPLMQTTTLAPVSSLFKSCPSDPRVMQWPGSKRAVESDETETLTFVSLIVFFKQIYASSFKWLPFTSAFVSVNYWEWSHNRSFQFCSRCVLQNMDTPATVGENLCCVGKGYLVFDITDVWGNCNMSTWVSLCIVSVVLCVNIFLTRLLKL